MPDTILRNQQIRRRDGGYGLRLRAVLYEDTKGREAKARFTRRNGRPQVHTVVPDVAVLALTPRVQAAVEATGMLPSVARGPSKVTPHIRRAHAMHLHGGELAFVRLSLPTLDGLPLRSSATVAQARELFQARLKGLAPDADAYNVALQRGGHGGIHLHILLPLRFLTTYPRRRARGAPAGVGGGVSFGDDIHIVRVGETEQDRAAVAAYMAREPDGRLDPKNMGSPVYLAAIEELLQHRETGEESQLTWYKLPRAWRS